MTGSGVGDFLVGGVLIVGGALTGQGWLVTIGTSLALGGASQIISPRAERQEGAQINVQSTQAAIPVVYGQTKVGLKLFDTRVDPNDRDTMLRAGAICLGSEDGSGIEDLVNVYFDEVVAITNPQNGTDVPTTDNGISSQYRLGAGAYDVGGNYLGYGSRMGEDAPTTMSDLFSRFGSPYDNVHGRGIAWMAFYMHWSREIWTGIPNITVEVKGNRVYDPRDSTWKWSDNPALCILDYLTSKRYGAGVPYAARDGGTEDEIDEQSFIDAANYADETVSTPEGSGPRFTLNGLVPTDRPIPENIAKLLTACRGDLVWQNGAYRLVIRKATTPTSFELTEDNIIGDWEFRREGADRVPNAVEATYVRASNRYQPEEIVWPYPDAANAYLTADDGYENTMELDLPYCTTEYEAYHTALVLLKEQRQDAVVQVRVQETALQLEVGDLVPFTHASAGWSAKEFWVIGMTVNPDRTVNLVLREYDATAYTLDTLNTESSVPGSSLPNVLSVDPPTGLVLTSDASTALQTQTDTYVPRIKVEWTGSPDTYLAYYEIRYKLASDSDWDQVKDPLDDQVLAYIAPVTKGETYDVEIRAVNTWGASSSWVSGQVTVSTTGETTIDFYAMDFPVFRGGDPGDPTTEVPQISNLLSDQNASLQAWCEFNAGIACESAEVHYRIGITGLWQLLDTFDTTPSTSSHTSSMVQAQSGDVVYFRVKGYDADGQTGLASDWYQTSEPI